MRMAEAFPELYGKRAPRMHRWQPKMLSEAVQREAGRISNKAFDNSIGLFVRMQNVDEHPNDHDGRMLSSTHR